VVARLRHGAVPVVERQTESVGRFLDTRSRRYRRAMALLGCGEEVRVREIRETGRADALFERFTVLFDVRQLSRHGAAPFTDDPCKLRFHAELLERAHDPLLCYVLLAGDAPVAFQLVLHDRRRAIRFGSTFDERYADASPGKLLADLVTEVLLREGHELVDRAPGGDPYKEDGATRLEPVLAPTLYASRASARRDAVAVRVRVATTSAASALGLPTARARRLRERLARAVSRPPAATARLVLRHLRRWTWSTKTMVVYRADRETWRGFEPSAAPTPIARNELGHFLLTGDGFLPGTSRQELMSRALERLRLGDDCYTALVDGRLAHVAWTQRSREPRGLGDLGARWPLPAGSAVMYDAWTAPFARGRGLQKQRMFQSFQDAFAEGAPAVFSEVERDNSISRHNVEKVGMRAAGILIARSRLGRRSCSAREM
jgi:hypothetical protein